jgi:uroporphyrinogen decarboxylase
MGEITPRQRVLTALARKEPDRVPFLEPVIEEPVALALLGLSPRATAAPIEFGQPGADVVSGVLFDSPLYTPLELAQALGLDGFGMYLFVRHEGIQQEASGRMMVAGGGIKSRADLARIHLPDPDDPAIYEPYRQFVERYRDSGYALYTFLNIGSDPMILGMGLERFALAVYEDPGLVTDMFDLYTDWYARAARHLCKLGFDFLWFGDDIAFKTAPYVSPKTFRELFIPRYRKVIEPVTLPWIFHSDGNLMPILDDLLSLGMSGLHPIEPGAMDLAELKQRYGDRVCLVGHISVDRLSQGTPEEIDRLVAEAIRAAAPGGGYIVGSSNSVPAYCRPENVRAMADAVERYGWYPVG